MKLPNRISDITYDWVIKHFDLDKERIVRRKTYKRRYSMSKFGPRPRKMTRKFMDSVISKVAVLLPDTKAGTPYDQMVFTVHLDEDEVIVDVEERVIESDFQVKKRIRERERDRLRKKLGLK